MFLRFRKKNGQSVLEYLALLAFVAVAIMIIQKYVVRSISGRYKNVGDSFGYGRQYDPRRTIECGFDYKYTNRWYETSCYEKCDCLSIAVTCGTRCETNRQVLCEDCTVRCTQQATQCNVDACDNDSQCGSPNRKCLNHQCVPK